jgi:hypothetical protein
VSEAAENEIVASGGFMVPPEPIYQFPPWAASVEWTDEDRARWKLEAARSDDPDDPEGFFRTARFSEPSPACEWD